MSNLISRTELFNELSRVPISQYAVDERTMIYNKINEMPTAETTGDLDDAIQEYIKSGLMELDNLRPKGHWLISNITDRHGRPTGNHRLRCDQCGKKYYLELDKDLDDYKLCPCCGADMRGERNDDK